VVAERQLLLCVEWLGEPVREQAGRGKNVLPSASVQAQSERSAANSQPVDGTFYATQIMANRVAVPPGITAVQLQNAIRSSISALFGDFGIGLVQQSLQVKSFLAEAGTCLVKVARAHAPMVRAAATAVCFVQQHPVRLSVIRIAGSQRTARKAIGGCLEDCLRAEVSGLDQTQAVQTVRRVKGKQLPQPSGDGKERRSAIRRQIKRFAGQ